MTTRTPPTQERKDAAKARRKEITAGFAALDPEARARLMARVGAVMQPNGHTLSMTNTCLALFQRADVSLVAGLHDWRKSGRKVKKEEHGILIFVPLGTRKLNEDGQRDEAGDTPVGFTCRYVFDISQTEEV